MGGVRGELAMLETLLHWSYWFGCCLMEGNGGGGGGWEAEIWTGQPNPAGFSIHTVPQQKKPTIQKL